MLDFTVARPSLKILSVTEHQTYQRNGFLILKNFINPNICNMLMDHAKKLIHDFNPSEIKVPFSTKNQQHAKKKYFLDSGDQIRFFLEEKALNNDGELTCDKMLAINKIGHALHDLDPIFNCFSRIHKIANLSHDLGMINPRLIQSMYICKQPHIGGEVNCHQDASYLFTHKQPVVGFWFALEDATLENGCLWAIPGGHNEKLKTRFVRQGDDTKTEIYDDSPWALDQMMPLEVTAGSVIVLNGLLPHMSKENISHKSRHAYTLHVMSANAEFATDNWLQRTEFKGFD